MWQDDGEIVFDQRLNLLRVRAAPSGDTLRVPTTTTRPTKVLPYETFEAGTVPGATFGPTAWTTEYALPTCFYASTEVSTMSAMGIRGSDRRLT